MFVAVRPGELVDLRFRDHIIMIYFKFTSYLLTVPEGHPEGVRHNVQGQIRTHFPFREIFFKSHDCGCEAMRVVIQRS